ncbi:hypothetical protein [Burkholderia lata]|uniref:hypothetical protein n=1 Tax=Burkholderia lata (strain ATCC 17760 / DSM 23089 / LMG 22485 / NCIMB 9086 / R18194 / 383) TaxID=482957 RepID=UPI001453118E|nr:hypothetical protein [Burkholderia lata]VWB98584.1 tail protein [Burkholderia lata]
MATNDFLVFGGGGSPNVIDQPTYAALAARLAGFQSGTALSAQLNKVWRQSSIMAAVLAQFTANFSGQNSVDDGTTATLLANLQAAINAAGITASQFDSSTKLATTAFVQRAGGNFQTRKYVSGSASLAASDSGSWVEAGGTGPTTITLPAPSTSNLTYTVTNVTSNGTAVTISTPSASIYNQGAASSTFSLDVGATVELVSDASNWTVISHYTRSPIAQTPAQFDNTTRLATTAFVLRALGNFSGFSALNTNTTLTAAQAGQAIQWYGASGGVITLPVGSTLQNGSALTFFNFGTGPITVATQGADFIWSSGNVQPVTLQIGDSLLLMCRGSTEWDVAGGTAAIQFTQTRGSTASQFDSSTKLATDAFVQRALGNFQTFVAYTANQTLTASQSGSVVNFWGGSASTITLPSVASMPAGGAFLFNNTSATAAVTIARAGSDTILANGGNTSIILQPSDNLLITAVGGTQWISTGGSAQLPYAGTAQRASGGVVGAVRNASMSVSAVSASATFTADEIVVETALGGGFFRLAGFNKTINLATTGAGGMDAGSAPASGYVALYAIYNPTTQVSALLAANATSSVAQSVYGGANMPSGYTASALVSVWPTNGSGQFVVGFQTDRKVSITNTNVLSTTTVQSSLVPLSIAGAVPPNARTALGFMSVGTSASNAYGTFNAASSAAGIGLQQFQGQLTGSFTMNVTFNDVQLITQQTICYAVIVNTGTMSANVYISGYTF